jgi:hypothetical protein
VIAGWLILLGILVLPALLLVGGWGYTLGRISEACCARCRYPVEGLRGPRCPECGGSLQGRGTLAPGARHLWKPPTALAVICRTLLIALPVLVWLKIENETSPRIVSTAHIHALSHAGLFESLAVRGRGIIIAQSRFPGMESNPRARTNAMLKGPAGRARLDVRDPAVRIEYDAPGGRRRTLEGMTDEDVLGWMQAAGIDVEQERALADARAIARLIRQVVAGSSQRGITAAHAGPDGLQIATVITDVRRTLRPRRAALILAVAAALCYIIMVDLFPALRFWGRWRGTGMPSQPESPADPAATEP